MTKDLIDIETLKQVLKHAFSNFRASFDGY
jgi:hypothetical protein